MNARKKLVKVNALAWVIYLDIVCLQISLHVGETFLRLIDHFSVTWPAFLWVQE